MTATETVPQTEMHSEANGKKQNAQIDCVCLLNHDMPILCHDKLSVECGNSYSIFVCCRLFSGQCDVGVRTACATSAMRVVQKRNARAKRNEQMRKTNADLGVQNWSTGRKYWIEAIYNSTSFGIWLRDT